jgi:hypothetical protein
MPLIVMLECYGVSIMLCVVYAECRKLAFLLSVIMLNVTMLSVILLNVTMLSVFTLNVVLLN